MLHAWGNEEVFTGFWLGGPKVRDNRRPRRWWEDNIKMDLRETEIDGANWIRLAQDGVQWRASVNTVMNLRVPLKKRDIFYKLSNYQLFK
jgi:hypothetical protein